MGEIKNNVIYLESILLSQRIQAVYELLQRGEEAVLPRVPPQLPEVLGELEEGRGLEEVADGLAHGDLVAVAGHDAHVEVHVAHPERGVQTA